MAITIDDLELALDFTSGCASLEPEAYIDNLTGKILFSADGIGDEIPDDVHDNSRYIAIPTKYDLSLGRSVVVDFAKRYLPNDLDTVYGFFQRKGAYPKFKSLLSDQGKLDEWYEFETNATKFAIRQWCQDNEVMIES